MRKVLRISNIYGQLPVEVNVNLMASADIITQQEDTANQAIYCYMDAHHTFIQTGDIEQLADDSVLLWVNNKTQRILFSRHEQSVAKSMAVYLGFIGGDSSAMYLSKRYDVSFLPGDGDTSTILLISKEKILRTGRARDSVCVRYNVRNSQMVETKRFKRTLIKIDKEEYADMINSGGVPDSLVIKIDKDLFLVKTNQTICQYLSVSHQAKENVPNVSSSLEWQADGNIKPLGTFAKYIVTKAF